MLPCLFFIGALFLVGTNAQSVCPFMPILAQDTPSTCFDVDPEVKRRVTAISTSSPTEDCGLKVFGCNGYDILYEDGNCDYAETFSVQENGGKVQTNGKNIASIRCNW